MDIKLDKIYVLSDQFGLYFIRPIKIAEGWENTKFLVYFKHENLKTLTEPIGNLRAQQTLEYVSNLLNNPRIVDNKYLGLFEVPDDIVGYIKNECELKNKSFPFINIDSEDIRSMYIKIPNISEIRDWNLSKII